jgi:hypothetical protein
MRGKLYRAENKIKMKSDSPNSFLINYLSPFSIYRSYIYFLNRKDPPRTPQATPAEAKMATRNMALSVAM